MDKYIYDIQLINEYGSHSVAHSLNGYYTAQEALDDAEKYVELIARFNSKDTDDFKILIFKEVCVNETLHGY